LTTELYGSAHRSCRLLRRPVAVAADIAARRRTAVPRGHAAEQTSCFKLKGAKHRA
jgi:hypothetical protein